MLFVLFLYIEKGNMQVYLQIKLDTFLNDTSSGFNLCNLCVDVLIYLFFLDI